MNEPYCFSYKNKYRFLIIFFTRNFHSDFEGKKLPLYMIPEEEIFDCLRAVLRGLEEMLLPRLLSQVRLPAWSRRRSTTSSRSSMLGCRCGTWSTWKSNLIYFMCKLCWINRSIAVNYKFNIFYILNKH